MRYAICPICQKTLKIATKGDLPVCYCKGTIGILTKDVFTADDKIIIYDGEFHECDESDWDKIRHADNLENFIQTELKGVNNG